MSEHFYTYFSYEEWGRGYIGSRGCECPPEEDNKYFGSSKDKTFNPTHKIILSVHPDRKSAYDAEVSLHDFFDVVENPYFANRSKQKTSGFTTQGLKHTSDAKGRIGKGSSDRERTPESRKKSSDSNRGKKRSKKTKERNSEAAKGKKWWYNLETKEVRKSVECPGAGWVNKRPPLPPPSKESNEKRSKTLRGKPKSDAHRKNLSVAAKKRNENKG
jgi:hypothetical protein